MISCSCPCWTSTKDENDYHEIHSLSTIIETDKRSGDPLMICLWIIGGFSEDSSEINWCYKSGREFVSVWSTNALQIEILRIGGAILIGVWTISCLLNLMVFTKALLRRNPCAMYFITLNIINMLCFYLGLLLAVLAVGFNIDPSTSE